MRSGRGEETDSVPGRAAREVPSVVVGVGASRGVPVEEVLALVARALDEAGLDAASVAELATVDTKGAEPGIVGAARRLGVPLVTRTAAELAAVAVPHPSGAVLAVAGTASVAEAAALAGGGVLLVPKLRSAARPARATCAVVRRSRHGAADPGAGAEEGVRHHHAYGHAHSHAH
ncbi:hypothetical protein DVZ84_29340 [Streptomyces parvulus]|uniref:CobE/GbiG C-terminal domain-containing protein n=1 Tax=Streptomyces parvulus TaxID=146923 RepID=A0A369UXE4_9ACTN|nr:hypothetical protein DVZ84_29340 [Streptomyces parvulus]